MIMWEAVTDLLSGRSFPVKKKGEEGNGVKDSGDAT